MDVTPLVKADTQIIQSYSNGVFRVSGETYECPILVRANLTSVWDVKGDFADLSAEDFEPLIKDAAEIDVVLLGCGKSIQFLPTELRNALKEKGLSVDVMDTGAACRTYNVIMAEGRRVVAALFPF